jgi:type I restriction enzyme S subunit
MKTAVIRSSWMPGYGYRLDTKPYVGGALETKILLESLTNTVPLHTLTAGFDGGIYNGPKFSRTYVDSPEYGVPFVGSSSMLYADLSDLPLLSRKQAESRFLHYLELKPGMSLISCSGTIGRMVYSRHDMAGLWSSQHILKVVPDPEKIPPGYLYAYLSSKFGVPLVVSGTYGSIIQSLGPGQVADLPVPRLADALEHEIHELVEQAGGLRTEASKRLNDLLEEFEAFTGLPPTAQLRNQRFALWTSTNSTQLSGRLDVNFHGPHHHSVLAPYTAKRVKAATVGQVAESLLEPHRFKRIEHDDPEHNAPLFGTGDIGNIDPEPISWIAAFPGHEAYAAGERTVLIPRSGQLNGIIGTATLPIGGVRTGIVSEHAIRIFCRSEADTGYIFLALRSRTGYLQLKARAFGGSIPTLDVPNIAAVLIPEIAPKDRERFGIAAFRVGVMRNAAIEKETTARRLVEDTIESHSGK